MRNSQSEEMANLRALGEFRAYWMQSPEYPDDNRGNNYIYYPVSVVYYWNGGKRQIAFESSFRAYIGAGPTDGTIDLDETEDISVELFHLTFNPAFQVYTFDSDNGALIISGSSPKMSGEYSVTIRPSIATPDDS